MNAPGSPLEGNVLKGLVVLEIAPSIPSSFAAQMLRWMGAEVTRLSMAGYPLDGDPTSAVQAYCNSGKGRRDITDTTALAEALNSADVVVTGARPAALEKLGMSPNTWAADFPSVVLASVTGYGLTGSRADHPASATTTYHAGGEGFLLPGDPVYSMFPERPPVRGGRFLADMDSGLALACGVLAALVRRQDTGLGEVVEVSAQEVEMGLNRTTLSGAFFNDFDLDRSHRGYDYGGLLRTADGWISLRPTEDSQWQSFARAIGRDDLADDPRFATRKARDQNGAALTATLIEWSRVRTREEIREVFLAAECPGGAFMTPMEVLADEDLVERGLFSPVAGGRAPGRVFGLSEGTAAPAAPTPVAPAQTGKGPLSGVVVIDLCWVAAGPYSTELLAFMGATVIKVESASRPDLFRRLASADDSDLDSSIRFVDINQGKLSVSLNLKDPKDRDSLLELVTQAHLVVDNYRPGVRDRLGIGDEDLRRVNPRIVTVSLSGFGATGSMRKRPGYASVFNAESGVGEMTGYTDGPPTEIRDSNDLRAGMAACAAGLAGLFHSGRTGEPVFADVAAREALVTLIGPSILEASWGKKITREGNALGQHTPHGVYKAGDGKWVAVTVQSDQEWANLVVVVPDLDMPAWATEAARAQNRDAIEASLGAWLAARDGADAALQLGEGGVPASVSMSSGDLLADQHLRDRGVFRPWQHPVLGEVTLIGSPIRFWRETAKPLRDGPPLLGMDTDSVLAGLPALK